MKLAFVTGAALYLLRYPTFRGVLIGIACVGIISTLT